VQQAVDVPGGQFGLAAGDGDEDGEEDGVGVGDALE